MIRNKKTIFILFVLLFFVLSVPATLGQYQNQEKIPGSQPTSDFPTYIKQIINFGFATIGILALFMLVIGAYQYLMAAGNIGKVDSAKDTISSAFLGLLLGLCSWVILNKINPDLVKIDLSRISGIERGMVTGQVGMVGNYTPTTPSENKAKATMQYEDKIKQYAKANNVPKDIAFGLVAQESGGNPRATSPRGAMGLTQLMPGTAADMEVRDAYDVDQNLNGGFRYLRQMYDQTGSWDAALAAYNAGLRTYQRSRGNWESLPSETRAFVPSVMGYANWYLQQTGERSNVRLM